MNKLQLQPNDGIMCIREVADYLHLSQAKIYRMANSGLIPALRLGKSWRFRRDILDEWTRSQTHGGGLPAEPAPVTTKPD